MLARHGAGTIAIDLGFSRIKTDASSHNSACFLRATLHREFDTATNRLPDADLLKKARSLLPTNPYISSGKPEKQGNFSRRTIPAFWLRKQPLHGPLAGDNPRFQWQKTHVFRARMPFPWVAHRRIQRRTTVPSAWAGPPRHFPRTSFWVVSGKRGCGVRADFLDQ